MEIEKIRALSDTELVTARNDAAEQLFRLNFQKSLGNVDGLNKLKTLKLDIARTQTVARERVIATQKTTAPVTSNVVPAVSTRTERKKAKKV